MSTADFLKCIVVFKPAHGVWRRRGEATSADLSAALCSAYHGLYSEAVVSSVASAVALAEVGRFREAVEYLQRAAKALHEAAKDVFKHVKITVQRLVELFVEAVTRMLAWIDEHKAYLFLMAAVAAGVIALSAALNLWGLVELEKLAYAASLTSFVVAGVEEYKEEALNILKNDPDPYEKFKKIAKEANDRRVKLAEPWESLRVLIVPKRSEEERLMRGWGAELYGRYAADKRMKKALFYATLALEEAFSVYRTALRKYAEEREKAVEKREVGEGPFKKVVYAADLGRQRQLAEEEEAAFENALSALRERLNEYAVKYGLRDLLDVEEGKARKLAEAEKTELSEFSGVNFGTKALAALIAYREYALGRRGLYGAAAWHWLEVGGSAWLLYYTPWTAYNKAEKAGVERPVAVEELVAEALRRLFLKPGTDHHSNFIKLLGSSMLALELEEKKTKEKTESYVFKLFRVEEGGGRKELGVRLRITKVRESITYGLEFDDVERWLGFFKQALEMAVNAAVEVGRRLLVEDRFPYMLSWVNSDVAISRMRKKRVLVMSTSHLWQLAETQALFDWSYVAVLGVSLTLEGPKPRFLARTSLEKLDKAIKFSAEYGWLKILAIKAKSWEELKRWVVENWGVVVEAAVRRLGEGVRGELEALRDKLNDDKIAREIVAPALLLIQAERLGVNEETLRYFGAVVSGAIDGDGHVSVALKKIMLISGKREIALLWAGALAAHSIKAKVKKAESAFQVSASGGDAARLAGLYFLYGSPLLEGDERIINHKLAGAVELGAEGLDIRWDGLRRIKGGVAADLTISVGGAAVKYNVYLRGDAIGLQFQSTDRSRVELAALLLRLAGVNAEVKKEEVGGRDAWYVRATTDRLAAGRKELRDAVRKVVEEALKEGWVDEKKARRWLEKLEKGLTLKEGWPWYNVMLKDGALMVRFASTNPASIEQEAQRLEKMGLKRGVHFSVKMPAGGKAGYVYILKEGLAYAARLSVRGEDKQQRELAADFVEHILQRAEKAGKEVYEKVKKIIDEGRARGSQTLEHFKGVAEVNGKTYVVNVKGWSAEPDKGRSGRKLLRIKITAEVGRVEGEHIVDPVVREYTITFGRRGGDNAAEGFAYARGDAPEVREADAERFSALVKALTGKEPRVYRMKDGKIKMACGGEHLEGFARFAELADAIMKWLEETSR